MRTLKSILFEDDLGTARLIHNEDELSEPEGDNETDKASNYSDYQESDQSGLKSKTESLNSMPELVNCDETAYDGLENTETKTFQSFLGKKYEAFTNTEMLLPDSAKTKSNPFGNLKCWDLLLRCERVSSGRKLPHNDKVWRPVLVKLEESILKFHAEDFESSPPFKIINLTWFYSFSIPGIKTQLTHSEFLFTTVLINALHTMCGRLAKTRNWSKVVKLGCANYTVLQDFIETVQKCVSSFPAFRPAGIFYKTEKVLVNVQDIYEVIQQEKHSVTQVIQKERHDVTEVIQQEKHSVTEVIQQEKHSITEVIQKERHDVTEVIQQEKHGVTLKQVQIMLNAKVSASPECSVHVKHTENLSKKAAIDDVRFHKCVKSRSLTDNQTVTARFLPLDNCWFQLMSWKDCCSKPTPLHCEVTVTACNYSSVQILARIFTGSTRLEVKSANNITLRFYIPSEWLETDRKPAVQTIQHCTDVTKGNVSYNSNAETMLWSIPKLSFDPCRNFYLNDKPLATLNTLLKPPSCCQEMVKVPVEMDFYTKGSTQSSDVAITSMKLGLKSFGKFKTSYTSMYHVKIPVTLSIG